MPVPPLPRDLHDAAVPAAPPSADAAPDDGDGELSPGGTVAAAWVAAIYTARFDEAAGTAARFIARLAATPAVAAAAEISLPAPSPGVGEARWPVLTAVTAIADGWWQVVLLVKTTRFGQPGPATTAAVVRVHVTDGLLVDGWAVFNR
jgi:hypothetical protein